MAGMNDVVMIIQKNKNLKSHILDNRNPDKSMCGLLDENQVTIRNVDKVETATCNHCKNTYMQMVMEDGLIEWTKKNVFMINGEVLVKQPK